MHLCGLGLKKTPAYCVVAHPLKGHHKGEKCKQAKVLGVVRHLLANLCTRLNYFPSLYRLRAPLASPAPSTISSTSATSSASSNSSRLVRQGTFTKEESTLSNTVLVDIDVDDKKPPR